MSTSERYELFTVLPPYKDGAKPYWHKVGSGSVNQDGSFSLYFDSFPTKGEGKIQMRKYVPREDAATQGGWTAPAKSRDIPF